MSNTKISAAWLKSIQQHISSLQYGVLQVTVDGCEVKQIEKTERRRFGSRRSKPSQRSGFNR